MSYSFNSWHHGLMSNSWYDHSNAIDEEKLHEDWYCYAPTVAQDTIIKIAVQLTTMVYDYI